MSVSDNLARLNVCCREIVEILRPNLRENEIERLNTLLETRDQAEFLDLALGFRKSLAFLDHEAYLEKLILGWNLLEMSFSIEVKTLTKKIKALQADTKTDQDVLTKLIDSRTATEQKKSQIKVVALQLQTESRIPFNMFIEDPSFDALAFHKKNVKPENWINKAMGKYT